MLAAVPSCAGQCRFVRGFFVGADAVRGEYGAEGLGELPCTIPDYSRNLTEAARWPRSIRKRRATCVAHEPSGCAVMPGQLSAAGTVLDDDQGIDAPQQHGARVHEVCREDAAGLRGQELPPARAGPAGAGLIPAL